MACEINSRREKARWSSSESFDEGTGVIRGRASRLPVLLMKAGLSRRRGVGGWAAGVDEDEHMGGFLR